MYKKNNHFMNYKQKYIKNKNKYLNLKKQNRGAYVQFLEDKLSILINGRLFPDEIPPDVKIKQEYNKNYFNEILTNILYNFII